MSIPTPSPSYEPILPRSARLGCDTTVSGAYPTARLVRQAAANVPFPPERRGNGLSLAVEITAPDEFRSVRGFPTEVDALLWIAEQGLNATHVRAKILQRSRDIG